MKKRIIILIFTYILALSVNLFDAMFYPDATIELSNFISSLIFLIAGFNFGLYILKNNFNTKIIKIFLILVSIGGPLIYLKSYFFDYRLASIILDILFSIEYPLYLFL